MNMANLPIKIDGGDNDDNDDSEDDYNVDVDHSDTDEDESEEDDEQGDEEETGDSVCTFYLPSSVNVKLQQITCRIVLVTLVCTNSPMAPSLLVCIRTAVRACRHG